MISWFEPLSIASYGPCCINFVGDYVFLEGLRSAASQVLGLTAIFWLWSLKGLKDAVDTSDFSVLPRDLAATRKAGESINRLYTSLALGSASPCFFV